MKLQQRFSEVKKRVTYCMSPPLFRTKHPCGWMKALFYCFKKAQKRVKMTHFRGEKALFCALFEVLKIFQII
jgi:hypothetical protein